MRRSSDPTVPLGVARDLGLVAAGLVLDCRAMVLGSDQIGEALPRLPGDCAEAAERADEGQHAPDQVREALGDAAHEGQIPRDRGQADEVDGEGDGVRGNEQLEPHVAPQPLARPPLGICSSWNMSAASRNSGTSVALTGPRAEPDFFESVGEAKTALTGRSNQLIFIRKIGAGEGIRTLDPNLGKVVLYP